MPNEWDAQHLLGQQMLNATVGINGLKGVAYVVEFFSLGMQKMHPKMGGDRNISPAPPLPESSWLCEICR